jgi:hypothetical protein
MQYIDNGETVVNRLLARACPNQSGLVCRAFPCKCEHKIANPQIAVVSSRPFVHRVEKRGVKLEVVQ